MKKLKLLFVFGMIISINCLGQIDKAQLSLDVSKKYQQNYTQLAKYTWQRKVEGFSDNKMVMSSLSSVTIGPDGKFIVNEIQKQSYVESKPGIRGAIQKSGQADMNEYVKNAIELTIKYVYLTQGEMVDLFTKGTLSELGNNIQAEGFNLLSQGDHLNYKFDKTSLFYVSQDIATVMNGDPVKAQVTYENVEGVNRVQAVTLNLPAVNITINLSNLEYAKKL